MGDTPEGNMQSGPVYLCFGFTVFDLLFTGKDEFGKILSLKATEAGVQVNYLIDDKEPTGTCAVCITGKHRYKSYAELTGSTV